MTASPAYDFVLFDWDGCLAQTLTMWMEAFQQTFATFGLYPERRFISENLGDWGMAKRYGVSDEDDPRFTQLVTKAVEVEMPGVPLYPGVRDLLDELRSSGVAVGMVTSAIAEHIKSATEHHGIAAHFDAIVTVDDVTHHKPHPEPIELALQRLGGTKDRAVMVGDSTNDLGAARNAGVDSILVYPPEHELFYELANLQELEPTHICRSFAEVRSVLLPD